MPFKVAIKKLLDDFTPAAKQLGAVNTIIPRVGADGKRVLIGDNTDWVSCYSPVQSTSIVTDSLRDRSASATCFSVGSSPSIGRTASRLGLSSAQEGPLALQVSTERLFGCFMADRPIPLAQFTLSGRWESATSTSSTERLPESRTSLPTLLPTPGPVYYISPRSLPKPSPSVFRSLSWELSQPREPSRLLLPLLLASPLQLTAPSL